MTTSLPARICDAHHHFWDLPGSRYLPEDLRADLATVPQVVRTVYLECGSWYRASGPEHLRVVGETEWVVGNADALTEAIVGTADLRHGPLVDEVLAAHVEAGSGRFRGIRQMAVWDPSDQIRPIEPDPGPHLLTDPAFRAGFELLGRYELSFDAWVYFPQLPELVDLARAAPDTPIVLNHLGGPIVLGPHRPRHDVLARWRSLMTDVARCPNVTLKLGGIGMALYGLGWHKQPELPTVEEVAEAWREPIRWCIEAFGPERCLFESNFPVDRRSMDYATLWHAFSLITDDLSTAERDHLFHDTACRAYRIGDPTSHRSPP